MALPELVPNLTKSESPLKVTWLQTMLDQQKKVVKDKNDAESPDQKLAFVGGKLDEVLNKTVSNAEQAPVPKQEASITWGLEGKPLESNPLSGSILRLLMEEPGMKEKIDAGIKNGHSYSLMHQPGTKNFYLWDKWNETKNGITTPRKTATPFLINNPEDIKPEIKEEVVPPVETPAFMQIPMIPKEEGQISEKKLDKLPEIKKEASPVNAPNNHWALMRSKFSNEAFNQKTPQEQQAFQEKADTRPQPHFVDKIREYEAAEEEAKPTFLEFALGGKIEGELLHQWEAIKNIPARAFLYPEKYTWGEKNNERTTEEYPEAFRALRAKVVGSIERLGLKGASIETMPLHEAIDKVVEMNLV